MKGLPLELKSESADRLKEAATMGDVFQIKALADELMTENPALGPLSEQLVRLADEFDFDGMLAMLEE